MSEAPQGAEASLAAPTFSAFRELFWRQLFLLLEWGGFLQAGLHCRNESEWGLTPAQGLPGGGAQGGTSCSPSLCSTK